MIFIIDKKTLTLRYQSGSLRLEKDNGEKQRIPIRQIEQLIVYGNTLIESSVLRALSAAAVPTVFLALRGPENTAMLGAGLATQLRFRRMQHRCADLDSSSIKLAKWFLDYKFLSYDLPLQTLKTVNGATSTDIQQFIALRNQTREKLKESTGHSSLLGLEGQLAHAWFGLMAKYLPASWNFSGRNRRPPRDPVNALMSLGYTLVLAEIREALVASGLDPSLGFLHLDTPGRESLALDFSEIFRAGVDNFVIQWVGNTDISAADFYFREQEGCRLSKAARPVFYKSWATYRHSWPRAIFTETGAKEWPQGILREQVNGYIAKLRETIKLEDSDYARRSA